MSWLHRKSPRAEAVGNRPKRTLCSGRTAAGKPCKAIAARGSGLCKAHQDGGSAWMARLGRRGGQGRGRTEHELLIGAGLGHTLADEVLYAVMHDDHAKQGDRLRAALAVLARAPARVERGAGGGWTPPNEVSEYLVGETGVNTAPSPTGFPTSQPEAPTVTVDFPNEPPERTAEEQRQLDRREREARRVAEHRAWMARMAQEYGQAREPEDLAEIQWRDLHPNGRRRRGRRRGAFYIDKTLTG